MTQNTERFRGERGDLVRVPAPAFKQHLFKSKPCLLLLLLQPVGPAGPFGRCCPNAVDSRHSDEGSRSAFCTSSRSSDSRKTARCALASGSSLTPLHDRFQVLILIAHLQFPPASHQVRSESPKELCRRDWSHSYLWWSVRLRCGRIWRSRRIGATRRRRRWARFREERAAVAQVEA